MSTMLDFALLASAVYDNPPNAAGWTCAKSRSGAYGFQAAAYTQGKETVIAFRGTAVAGDVGADLKLGVGMNTNHFSQADDFVADFLKTENLSLCGHSLGGAIAQIVGNRSSLKFATFNAPGVAVVASRNILEANPVMLGVRMAGAVVGALVNPMQAARDVRATFNTVTGVNICLTGDVVSKIGVHYGNVVRIPGTGLNPATQHGIGTVIEVLRQNPVGKLTIESLA